MQSDSPITSPYKGPRPVVSTNQFITNISTLTGQINDINVLIQPHEAVIPTGQLVTDVGTLTGEHDAVLQPETTIPSNQHTNIITSTGSLNDLIQQSETVVPTNVSISTDQAVDVNALILQLGKISLGLNEVERVKRELETKRENILNILANHPQYITLCSRCNRPSFGNPCILCHQNR